MKEIDKKVQNTIKLLNAQGIKISIRKIAKDLNMENSLRSIQLSLKRLEKLKEPKKEQHIAKIIKWRDSNMFITQGDIDGDYPVAELESIGFIIREDDTKIVLAGDIVDGEVRRVISIPKENIIK